MGSEDKLAADALLPVGDNALRAALNVVMRGELVGIPTETVYGLAADATNGQAVASLYAAKGRPQFNPLICHVDSFEMAQNFGLFDERAELLVQNYWPGSLTIVLPKHPECSASDLVTAGLESIALRCPDSVFSRSLIAKLSRPLAAPSANLSGQLSPTTALAVRTAFSESIVPLVVDGGSCSVGLESTIVSCLPGQPVTVLRPGLVTAEELQTLFGEDQVRIHQPSQNDDLKPAAPGMLSSHYAPNARVEMIETQQVLSERSTLLTFAGAYLPVEAELVAIRDLSPSGSLKEAAANLFSMLRELDEMKPDCIYVVCPPQQGLGVAIHDRLQRAAAPRINAAQASES